MDPRRLSPVDRYLQELYDRHRDLASGVVADYIPELAKADPSWFGICIATVDGHVYEVGDARLPFTIQSISKPFVYGLALEDRGRDAVLQRIGVEPSGEAFNEISLEAVSGRPLNPMINAGAITATSLVAGHSFEDRLDRILALFSMYAGRSAELNESVYRSERETGHRNRAISHMLRNFDILEDDPDPVLDLYFRQCSIDMSCRDLSVMGATLATGGVNPVTRERVLDPSNVDEVLSVMTTCGMYDYAGEWVYRVGLPAKSGVAGGILAVLPGQLGIAVFSPPLDGQGNSVRGIAVCEALSNEMELHFLRAPRASLSTIRWLRDLRWMRSRRIRSDPERQILDQHGPQGVVVRLQGDLSFPGMEVAQRHLVEDSERRSHFVIDFSRVNDIDPASARLLLDLWQSAQDAGQTIAFVGLRQHRRAQRLLDEATTTDGRCNLVEFDDLDLAIEWCEDSVLAAHGWLPRLDEEVDLSKHELLESFSREQVERLTSHLERRELRAREIVVRTGDPADSLYLLVRGDLSVSSDTTSGRLSRLSTLPPGKGFGEQFLVEGAVRGAFVRADTPAVCWTLSAEAFHKAASEDPDLGLKLLQNLLASTSRIMQRLTSDALTAAD